jgi:hypothetical protein
VGQAAAPGLQFLVHVYCSGWCCALLLKHHRCSGKSFVARQVILRLEGDKGTTPDIALPVGSDDLRRGSCAAYAGLPSTDVGAVRAVHVKVVAQEPSQGGSETSPPPLRSGWHAARIEVRAHQKRTGRCCCSPVMLRNAVKTTDGEKLLRLLCVLLML